jgi:hypothetical protein
VISGGRGSEQPSSRFTCLVFVAPVVTKTEKLKKIMEQAGFELFNYGETTG